MYYTKVNIYILKITIFDGRSDKKFYIIGTYETYEGKLSEF